MALFKKQEARKNTLSFVELLISFISNDRYLRTANVTITYHTLSETITQHDYY